MKKLSRREFLRSAATGAVGVAALGLAGAVSATEAAPAGGEGAAAAEGGAPAGGGGPFGGGPVSELPGDPIRGSSWLGEAPEIDSSSIVSIEDYDVVVIGMGHAGTACFRRAAEMGKSVVGLESQDPDVFSVLGNDIGHLNSKWQMEYCGIPKYDEIDFMNEYQATAAGRAQPDLIRQFAYRSGEAFDWFIEGYTEEEVAGILALNWPVVEGYEYQKGMFHSYVGTPNFGAGLVNLKEALLRSMQKGIDADGKVVYNTAGRLLVKDADGRVTGVIAENENGEYVQYNGRLGVVLCTGDYSGNSEMYNALCNEVYELGEYAGLTGGGRDGSGIRMGLWAGGKMEIGTRGAMGGQGAFLLTPLEAFQGIWLNANGKRFCNEAFGGPLVAGAATEREPNRALYTLWDANWRDMIYNQAAGHLACKEWTDSMKASFDSYMEQADGGMDDPNGVAVGERGKIIYCASSLDKLFEMMGMNEEEAANAYKAVERYNAFAAAGRDDDYGKAPNLLFPIDTAPFYGFAGTKTPGGGSLVTTSGLMVNGEQQVIGFGNGYEPIPGLYACGNAEGGRFPMGYNGIMNGVSIGMCLCLGYCLGEQLGNME